MATAAWYGNIAMLGAKPFFLIGSLMISGSFQLLSGTLSLVIALGLGHGFEGAWHSI